MCLGFYAKLHIILGVYFEHDEFMSMDWICLNLDSWNSMHRKFVWDPNKAWINKLGVFVTLIRHKIGLEESILEP